MAEVKSTTPVQFENIPNASIKEVLSKSKETHMKVKFRESGIINITKAGLQLLIVSFQCATSEKIRGEEWVKHSTLALLSKLYSCSMNGSSTVNTSTQKVTEVSFTLNVDRAEVSTLKDMLLLRMQHCELERDQRVMYPVQEGDDRVAKEKFNPDTYIAMKWLLMDLRDWLTIEEVPSFINLRKDSDHAVAAQ